MYQTTVAPVIQLRDNLQIRNAVEYVVEARKINELCVILFFNKISF